MSFTAIIYKIFLLMDFGPFAILNEFALNILVVCVSQHTYTQVFLGFSANPDFIFGNENGI